MIAIDQRMQPIIATGTEFNCEASIGPSPQRNEVLAMNAQRVEEERLVGEIVAQAEKDKRYSTGGKSGMKSVVRDPAPRYSDRDLFKGRG